MAEMRAKRSSVLENLKKDISKGFIDLTAMVNGHKFKLRTLNEDDEVWADSFARTSTAVSMITSRRAPRLAASIMSIDDVVASDLFLYPEGMSKEEKKAMDDNPITKKYWIYDQMLYFLLEESNRPFINDLWSKFEELEKSRDEALKELPKS